MSNRNPLRLFSSKNSVGLGLALYLCVFYSSPVFSWWNDQWTARKQLTVDASITGGDISETLRDFPMLIRLHTGNFGFFLDLAEGGKDIRLIGGGKLPLKFHVEKIDMINEMAFVWVKIPSVTGGSNSESVWMYYGNPDAVSGEDAAGSYDVNMVGVYHFGDQLSADATAYGNHATEANALAESSGFIGSAARFQGAERLVVGPSESLTLDPASGWSVAFWIKPAEPSGEAVVMHIGTQDASVELVARDGSALLRANTPQAQTETAAQALQIDTWQHVTVNYDGSRLGLFIAGEEVAASDVALPVLSAPLQFGADSNGRYFTGLLDEVEISNIGRSPDWIKLIARSQGVDSTVMSFGGDESNQSGGGSSYFAIILSNVSTDGWVIIGLLALMLLTSLIVMVSKGVVISRVRKDNRSFITRFRELGRSDPAALDHDEDETDEELEDSALLLALFGTHDHYQNSSLYHIYHAGIQEIKHRKADALKGLSPEAVAVVRVHLDAAMSRESQRLNKQMVLLTIAISGGPFLGLLGTVIGVMITFAAIAATGDVNISAIAPGVSAALMTTVAGLAVAIPCLFGYNYLATQIKELIAEMRIFVNEFIQLVTEQTK